ncbi:MAG TPA: phosphoribosylglycinamide formyltransferase [Thermoleophilia bacterium]
MFKLAVLASGSGTNLQAIIDKLHVGGVGAAGRGVDGTTGDYGLAGAAEDGGAAGASPAEAAALAEAAAPIEVALVVSDNASAPALQRAAAAGIPIAVHRMADYASREEHDLAMAAAIEDAGANLVIMAGYMHLLSAAFLARFPWRVINLHPALLPAFPGTTSIADAIGYGVKVTGVTVHFVDAGMDTGPVICQEPVRVEDEDSAESLAVRIHALEHELLPRAIELIASGKVTPPATGSRTVRVKRDS